MESPPTELPLNQDRTKIRSGSTSRKVSEKFVPWEPYKGATQRPNKPSVNTQKPVAFSGRDFSKISNGTPETAVLYRVGSLTRKNSCKKQLALAAHGLGSREDLVLADGQEKSTEDESKQKTYEQKNSNDDKNCIQRTADDGQHSSEITGDGAKIIEELKKERDYYKEQVSYQSQVNAELKRLVVASMGDDLQLHLEGLSQDKARLAQNIDHYSRELSVGNENLEKLAIDADVWRSKYLACSVMVDELVGWRLYLIRTFEESQKCMAQILKEHENFRQHLFQTILLLMEIRDALDPLDSVAHKGILTYHNLYDLVMTVHSIADSLHNRLMNGRKHEMMNIHPQKGLTDSEEMAAKLLSLDTDLFYGSSPADKGNMQRKAKLLGMAGMNCKFKNLTVNCCKKCNGEIQLV